MYDAMIGRGLRRVSHVTRRLVLAAVLGAAVACGSDSPAGPAAPKATDPVTGMFSLSTVNTDPLPFSVFADAGYTLEVTSGTADVRANGQFILVLTTRETVAGHASVYVDSTTGTWTQNGATVTFTAVSGVSGRHPDMMAKS